MARPSTVYSLLILVVFLVAAHALRTIVIFGVGVNQGTRGPACSLDSSSPADTDSKNNNRTYILMSRKAQGPLIPAPAAPKRAPVLISIYDVKCDIMYNWRYGVWPPWLGPKQIKLREKFSQNFIYKNGTLLPEEDLWNLFKKYQPNILDPDFNRIHYEFCWYLKYDSWKTNPKNYEEQVARGALMNRYLYSFGQRISQREVQRLCPNYRRMKCGICLFNYEKNCFFAQHGIWKSAPPSLKDQRRFFYNGKVRITVTEIVTKCAKYFDADSRLVYYPDCTGTNVTPI